MQLISIIPGILPPEVMAVFLVQLFVIIGITVTFYFNTKAEVRRQGERNAKQDKFNAEITLKIDRKVESEMMLRMLADYNERQIRIEGKLDALILKHIP